MKKFLILYLFIRFFSITVHAQDSQPVDIMIEGDTLVIFGEGVIGTRFISNSPLFSEINGKTWSLVIREGITDISPYAFECGFITSISVPASVTKINDQAFSSCNGLVSITVSKNNTIYSSYQGVVFNKIGSTLIAYPPGRAGSYSVPAGVSVVGPTSFWGCMNLTSIVFSVTVVSIETGAFVNCKNLTSITFPLGLVSIKSSAFSSCDKISDIINFSPTPQNMTLAMLPGSIYLTCTVRVPIQSVITYKGATVWSSFVNIVPLQVEINVDYHEIYLMRDATKSLAAQYTGGVANPNTIVWGSSNHDVATVDNNGNVIALMPGSTSITATIPSGESACTLSVIEKGRMFVDKTGTKIERAKLYLK